jgi:hypothetical protein
LYSKTRLPLWIIIFFIWIALIGSCWLYLDWQRTRHVIPAIAARIKAEDKYFPKLQADLATVSRTYLVSTFTHGKDAGVFLNKKIQWQRDQSRESKVRELALPEDLVKKVRNKNWINLVSEAELKDLNFSWMAELKKYDYWDVHKNSGLDVDTTPRSLTNIFADDRFWVSPKYTTLEAWSRLRLVKGLRSNSLVAAAEEVRHFGRLIQSNETDVSGLFSLNIYASERQIYDYFVESTKGLAVGRWQPASLELIATAKRACASVLLLFDPYSSDKLLKQLYAAESKTLCKCQGINVKAANYSLLGSSVRRHLYKTKEESMTRAILETKTCRSFNNLKKYWQKRELAVLPWTNYGNINYIMTRVLGVLPASTTSPIFELSLGVPSAEEGWSKYAKRPKENP